jgi:hypothetical protein
VAVTSQSISDILREGEEGEERGERRGRGGEGRGGERRREEGRGGQRRVEEGRGEERRGEERERGGGEEGRGGEVDRVAYVPPDARHNCQVPVRTALADSKFQVDPWDYCKAVTYGFECFVSREGEGREERTLGSTVKLSLTVLNVL